MYSFTRILVVGAGVIGFVGCGSDSSLPPVPTTDTRPAEVKEADDAMLKNNAKVNAGLKH